MKERLKKLTALLLSIAMVCSMCAEYLPIAAFAADEEGGSTPETTVNTDFSSNDTRRPGLYVDFLGDNRNYQAPEGERDTVIGSGIANLTAPGKINQSQVTNEKNAATNPNGTENTWTGYKQNEVTGGDHSIYDGNTIFWVGVGIDRMNVLELFQEEKGIYSTELAFYYDSTYIEPYTGADGNYKAVIEAANLTNYQNYKWDGYTIVDAQTALIPYTDPVTQEVIRDPDMAEILGTDSEGEGTNPWRMTYVSIEKTNVDSNNRFSDIAYNEDDAADLGTQYLLIIPFKLKAYDPFWESRVCLRLARSAGLLSIGGGQGGDTTYAAWERVTTRNPGHELKLMTNFQGDLNIFSGGRKLEEPYRANLIVDKAGGTSNSGQLSITDDPSPNKVVIDSTGQYIDGLYGGTGLTLNVHVDTGYSFTVRVYYDDDESMLITPTELRINDNNYVYTFIMPEHDVTVEVIFSVTDATMFRLHLDEMEEYADTDTPADRPGSHSIQGNGTVLTATYVETAEDEEDEADPTVTVTEVIVDKDSPDDNSLNLPAEMVRYTAEVTAEIQVHGDYEAVVWVENLSSPSGPYLSLEDLPEDATLDGATNTAVLPTGGTLVFHMPSSDTVFHVIYRPAQTHNVLLSVYHSPNFSWSDMNVAQLATTVYTDDNRPLDAYSGVVYQDHREPEEDEGSSVVVDHSALKDKDKLRQTDPPLLERVDISSAQGSQSLGGDGRQPAPWSASRDSIMATLYAVYQRPAAAGDKAIFQDDLKGRIMPLDLRARAGDTETSTPAWEGLRKNTKGEFYTDTDLLNFTDSNIQAFYDSMYSLLQKAAADPTYKVDDTDTDGAYSYYDLSLAQVQVYILEYAAYQQYLADAAQYADDMVRYYEKLTAYNDYLAAKKAAEDAGLVYSGPTVRQPTLPTVPDLVNEPVIRDADSAETELATYQANWYKPTETPEEGEPQTLIWANNLDVRASRKMAVVLESASTFTVADSIVILEIIDRNKDDEERVERRVLTLADRSPDYQNVYLFDMPDYDCEVRVTYTSRYAYDLALDIEVIGNDPDPNNYVTVTGYGPDEENYIAAPVVLTKDGDHGLVLESSTVTVEVHVGLEYTVSARVEYEVEENSVRNRYDVPTVPANITDMPDGYVFTFIMPEGATTIYITYTSTKVAHRATIVPAHYYDTVADTRNTGVWEGTNSQVKSALEGEELVAEINVQPGYYIYAVETYTESGSPVPTNPVTISGNGWNNGAGGEVIAKTVMPDANYFLRVVFRAGPPDPEPAMILSLKVNDQDNTGTPPADNWATIQSPKLGPVGLGSTGMGILLDKDYVRAGDTAQLEIHVADGYFVESVEIQPTNLGAGVVWKSRTENPTTGETVLTAEFTMPAASATAVVTFRKAQGTVQPKILFLHLDKTEMPDGQSSNDNYIYSFISDTVRPDAPGGYVVSRNLPTVAPTVGSAGAAKPGELVELDIRTAANWYIHSLSVTTYEEDEQGNRVGIAEQLDYTLSGNGWNNGAIGSATASFIMPDTDAYVVVNYRTATPDNPPPDPDDRTEFEVELVVDDPYNVGPDYADNWAQAWTANDNQTRKVGKGASAAMAADGVNRLLRDLIYAKAGDVVTVRNSPDTDYSLDIIIVTPSGLRIIPTYKVGGAEAYFTMPDSDVTVTVRFKTGEPNQYTANLVLHFPDSVAVADYDSVGEGSFYILGQFGLDEPDKLYSLMATPGTKLDLDLLAHDGYYISHIDVNPEVLGLDAQYTGIFGRQSGWVVMPGANIIINVYFKEAWPDNETDPVSVTLEVYDSSGKGGTANFKSIGRDVLNPPDNRAVGHGDSLTLPAFDDDRVVVELHPAPGCDVESITVTDSRGKAVPWDYVAGGIEFHMSPAHVTVVVKYYELPDPGPDDPYKDYNVRLHVTGAGAGDTVKLTDGTNTLTDTGSFTVTIPPHGRTLTLTVWPGANRHVVAAYAVASGTGRRTRLTMTWVSDGKVAILVPAGGEAEFAMPDSDVDVYVEFAADDDRDHPGPDPDRHDLLGTLTVVGPENSGSGIMYGNIDETTPVSTGTVTASGEGSLYAPLGTLLTVDLTVADGFSISVLRVTDGYGNPVDYDWADDGLQRQFTLTMPATDGVWVYVELEKVTTRDDHPDPEDQLTAQVVVNNGGNSGNTAVLRYGNDPSDSDYLSGTLITPVYAGDQIWVDIVVQPGYEIEYVKVTPVKYGLDPTLDEAVTASQSTSFRMPGEDVVVYVKFIKDNRVRRNVLLVAEGLEDANDPIENQATIYSDYSGLKGPVHPVTPLNRETVQAAPPSDTQPAEWVVVDYTWAEGYSIKSLTVKDAAGNDVTFTQSVNDKENRKGQIKFPMVDANVVVTIVWGTKEELPKYPAILHVIDLDSKTEITGISWGQLTWLNPPADDTDKHQTAQVTALPTPGGTETLMVPAGETVRVDANTGHPMGSDVYIQAAFVLHRAGGQMIRFNFKPDNPGDPTSVFSGEKDDTFIMHPGQNDVYIYYTTEKPVSTDYSAVLMLDSPVSDTTSTATIERTRKGADAASMADSVKANDPDKTHGYVTAYDGDTITVTVNVAEGYSIESILMTPLGICTEQGGYVELHKNEDGTYTFTMPAENVAVRIKLRVGTDEDYKATLHYKRVTFDDDGTPTITDVDTPVDWASMSYSYGGATVTWTGDESWRMVPEGIEVTLGASITGTDYVLAAYVLRESGDIVPMDNILERLTETHNPPDPTLLEEGGTAHFTMPAADVDAYVWFTDKMPAEEWHTAVLTVTDSDPNGGSNSASLQSSNRGEKGKEPVTVWSTGVPGHEFLWVTEGETVTVADITPATGYSFVNPATITHSDSSASETLTEESTEPYVYTYTVGPYNSAVVAHFERSDVTRNSLNVVLIDVDNPGNGTATNAATVTPALMASLVVASTTSSGARQRIPSVLSGTWVDYTVAPESGYSFVARLLDDAGNQMETWPVNTLTGDFTMPNHEATLEIIFYRTDNSHRAILTVVNADGDFNPVSKGQMTESAFGLPPVEADTTGVTGIYASLPNGTELEASITQQAAGTKLIQVLALTASGSTPVAASLDDPDAYRYKLAGEDVEIRMIVDKDDDPDPENWNYIASVSATNLPTGTGAPTIQVTPTPNPVSGSDWTVAKKGDTLEVTVTVPYGYKAIVTSNDVTLDNTPPTIEINGPADAGDPDVVDTATFAMPAKNVHVTVTYVRTRFDATIQAEGTGLGTATMADRRDPSTSVSVDNTTTYPGPDADTLHDRTEGEVLDYTAAPINTDNRIDAVFYNELTSGTMELRTSEFNAAGAAGTVTMPADDVKVTVVFADDSDDDPRRYKAYVTLEDTDGLPDNTAQDIVDTVQDLGGGYLWAYGDTGDEMLVTFTTDPNYWAEVKAYRVDDGTELTVNQQGITGACTARVRMPGGTDVKVVITYHGPDEDPPKEPHTLEFRLVGHGGESGNYATLYTDTQSLTLQGSMQPSGAEVRQTVGQVVFGTDMYVDATRLSNYMIQRITVEVDGIETTLWKNDYGLTSMANLTMPGADALVTVYYRLPYTAQFEVVDKDGMDYSGGVATDTAIPNNGKSPKVTLTVTEGTETKGTTTFTHTKIGELVGTEKVTATVDLTTMPDDAEIASVIATTSSGTYHLRETAPGSGIYEYMMSDGTRLADDVTITVVLRDDDPEHRMYTATVYKEGHDDLPGNDATITDTNPPKPVPAGTIWTGAYENDLLEVHVTTAPGYYAVVTAVRTDKDDDDPDKEVPVLQWTAVGPFDAQFYMPAADVDVTVTYSKDPPTATLALRLEGHEQKVGNEGSVYDMDQEPEALIPDLTLQGNSAPDFDPIETDSVDQVAAGTNLEVRAGAEPGYSVKAITVTVPGFAPIPLTVSAANVATTTMPVVVSGKAVITVIFEQGEKSPRPFDPWHSTIYNSSYPTLDDTNPDLSTDPVGEEGWILADNQHETTPNTIVVTIPTLYEYKDADHHIENAGVADDLTEKAPTYTFYWKDELGVYHQLVEGVDITLSGGQSYLYDDPTGAYTDGQPHYGYELLTIEVLPDTTTSPLLQYIEEGGTIFVTATKPVADQDEGDGEEEADDEGGEDAEPLVIWAESDKTQVIIEPAKTYTATLHIVDLSSSLNNQAELSVQGNLTYGGGPATEDGDQITKLLGKETLQTQVTPDTQVKVVSVLAIPENGSPSYLTPNDHLYDMVEDNVDIFVTFANEEDELYTATVVKVDPDNDPGNTVGISNPTHPVLNRDISDPARWTLAYTGDEIRVDITAATGYKVTVTAKRLDNGASLTVIPDAGAGGMVVVLDDPKMPDSNIEITVTFEQVEDTDGQSWVTLEMRMENGSLPVDPANWATATGADKDTNTVTLTAEDRNNYTDTNLMATGTVTLDAYPAPGYRVKEVRVNGVVVANALTSGVTVSDPTTTITVILEEADDEENEDITPRPFDPGHSVHYPGADHGHDTDNTDPTEPHQDGYLLAKNLGNSLVKITVPNLYQGKLFSAEDVVYTLYAKVNGAMVELLEGIDYDYETVIPVDDYLHDGPELTGDAQWNGQFFTIKSLNPTGVLGEYVRTGGVIYITATGTSEPESAFEKRSKSAYTEVVIPRDPNLPDPDDPDDPRKGYTVTLYVIDDTTGKNNAAEMENANDGRNVLWATGDPEYTTEAGHIDHLTGGELIRTEVTPDPDPNVSYTVMVHTDSMGDVLLFPDPTGTDRYRKTMPSEDMDVIVHFREPNEDGQTPHMVAVEKRGATGVAGNEAYVEDLNKDDHPGLLSGSIWTEGYEEDKIQVKVTTADGYYATVTMSYVDPDTGILVKRTMVVKESGNPDPILVEFDMPDADVQVVVEFTNDNDASLRPYDPDNVDSDDYEDHWIRAENRGDYLIVTVPQLNNSDGSEPTSVDDALHRFQLHLQVDGTNRNSPIVNVTDLLKIRNVLGYDHPYNVNPYYNPTWVAGTDQWEEYYENGIYNRTSLDANGDPYNGARFIVEILPDDEIDPADQAYADILREIFDNDGTMGTNGYRLYITSDETESTTDDVPDFRANDYADLEVPRYYTLAGTLVSWAPTHKGELTLYLWDEDASAYQSDPWMIFRTGLDLEEYMDELAIYNGRWAEEIRFRSSELNNKTYKLVVEKTAHITYTRTEIELDPVTAGDQFDHDTLVYTINEDIALFAGDLAPLLPGPNQIINGQDRDLLSGFIYGMYLWTTATAPDQEGWADSVFNPDSYAYAADLDGNGRITETDMSILMSSFNFGRRAKDYGNPTGLIGPNAAAIALALGLDVLEVPDESMGWEELPEISFDPDLIPDFGVFPDVSGREEEVPEISFDPDLLPDFGVIPADPDQVDPDASENPEEPEVPAFPEVPEEPTDSEDTEDPEDPAEGSAKPDTPAWPEISIAPDLLPGFGVFPTAPPDEDAEPPLTGADETGENQEEEPDITTEESPLEASSELT